jgi:hypothetical protein
MKRIFFFLLLSLGFFPTTNAQSQRRPVQFSGVVISSDSLTELPFVTVYVKNRRSGTFADQRGFFSMAVMTGDTVVFSALGFKDALFVIPLNSSEEAISVIQRLEIDPVTMKGVQIYPFTKEEFKDLFVRTKIPDDMLARAQKNLSFNPYIPTYADPQMVAITNAAAFKDYQWRQGFYAGTQNGMIPMPNGLPIPTTLLSPAAWYNLIKSLKNK